MGLKIKAVKDVEKDIKFMTDLDVDFVSLVPHGANKEPFRIIKSVKGGNMDNYVVQSLIFAEGADIGELAQKSDLGWVSELPTENVEKNDSYSKIVHIDASQFDTDTLQLLKIDDIGVWAIVGKLHQESDQVDGAIVISEKQVKDIKTRDTKNFFQTPVTDENLLSGWYIPSVTAGDLLYEEMWNMQDVLYSVLRQEGLDAKTRKKAVLASIDAFRGFVSMLLDSAESSVIKINKNHKDKGEEDMDLFKTKEEFEKAVDDRVNAAVDAALKSQGSPAPEGEAPVNDPAPVVTDDQKTGGETPEATTPATPDDKSGETIPAWAKSLTEDLKAFKTDVTERISKMENSPSTEPANGTDTSSEGVVKSDDGGTPEPANDDADFHPEINPKYRGAFSGLFGDLRG